MDLGTFIGAFLGVGLCAGAVIVSQGVSGLFLFLNPEALMVVIGGTFAAILVAFPFSEVKTALSVGVRKALFSGIDNTAQTAMIIIEFSKKIKALGFAAMDRELDSVKDEFIKRGLKMAIDGADETFIQHTMGAEIDLIKEREKVSQHVFTSMGTFAPAFGIIGTVLGMIIMLSSISNVDEVPRHMATALSSAFIGMGFGYFIFLPMVEKLKRRSEIEIVEKEMVISGIILIQRAVSPSLVEACMTAYLTDSKRQEIKKR